MITNFKLFGVEHMISILIPCLVGSVFIYSGLRTKSESVRKNLRILLAIMIILIRGARYIMDAYYGRFEWLDLFSLHICHIDLILLIVCLIKPREALFNFVFLVGIPMGLAVALFPGTNHPIPGMPRAMLFIMSHVMLVIGAVYLASVERMRASFRHIIRFIVVGNIGILAIYLVNKGLGSNFLYIMEAPAGTVLQELEKLFGWPGYVIVMDVLAIVLIILMLLVWKIIFGGTGGQVSCPIYGTRGQEPCPTNNRDGTF